MALLYQRVLSMLKTQHQCHDVIPQHRAATGRSLMWSWCHILNCPCRGSAASRSVTSDPQLAIRDIQSDNKMAGVSRCRDRPRAISSWREETLMLAPLPLRLHVPQSCAHGISPCGMVLSADRQGSFFFTQALETLPCCAAVPACTCRQTRCHHLPHKACRRRSRKSGVSCKLHTVIKAGNSTAPMGA
jgi:hypothetical protein